MGLMKRYVNLLSGDPAPFFIQKSISNPRFAFNTAGGRYMVLCFFGTAKDDSARAAIMAAKEWSAVFDDQFASFFGVSIDPDDMSQNRISESYPGYRHFLDYDLSVSRQYGAIDLNSATDSKALTVRRIWVVIDPTFRVLKVLPFEPDQSDIRELKDFLSALPPPIQFAGIELQAPVLYLPNVFERELCAELVGLYTKNGGTESGFMREIEGKTVAVVDPSHKRRRDYNIEDGDLIRRLQERVLRRIVPEIGKVHQFKVTRMERYIVACYSEEDQGHFRPHRDNTTKGTAHRRFAVSINLNSEFEGGEIYFPEYNPRSYKPPPGGAVVFSCSLLHAVTPVTKGQRYAFLPFLYDDAAAELRMQNNKYLDEAVGAYQG